MDRVAILVALARGAVADVTVSSLMTNSYALDSSECYAPTEEGGWGYCGAPTCRDQRASASDRHGSLATARLVGTSRAPERAAARRRSTG